MTAPAPTEEVVDATPGSRGHQTPGRTLTVVIVAVAAVLGLGYAAVMPPFQFNDEHAHFARAWQISGGEFIGRADSKLPSAILAALTHYPEGFPPGSAPKIALADLFTGGKKDFGALRGVEDIPQLRFFTHGVVSSQVYWAGCYLPAAAGIRMARLLGMSPLGMMYGARLMNLAAFLAALTAALWLAPGVRALVTAVALMPMTLQQAVAISADSMTIAFALLGFAMILRAREQPVGRRYLALLLALVPLWTLCKNSMWALSLLLLIPHSRFRSKTEHVGFLAGTTMLVVAVLLLWRSLTSDALGYYAAWELSKGLDLYGNAHLFIVHPLQMMHDLLIGPETLAHVRNILYQFTGTFSWGFYLLPFSLPYLAMLFVVAVAEPSQTPFAFPERAILCLTFVAGLIQIYAMLFIIDGTYTRGHYAFRFAGVQGRYLIPFCLAGFLTLKQKQFTLPSRILTPAVLCASSLCGLLSLATINGFFYR